MNKLAFRLLMIAAAGSVPLSAAAAPRTLNLDAGNVLARTRSAAMLGSVTGTFGQLSGSLRYDAGTGACALDVSFVVSSLQLPNAMIRDKTMSAGFLDPAAYPTEHYVAVCQGGTLTGALTLRGQTHPFSMAFTYDRAGDVVTGLHAAGTLNRYDWGINGARLLVGKVIRVTNDISMNGAAPAPPR